MKLSKKGRNKEKTWELWEKETKKSFVIITIIRAILAQSS